MKIQKIPRKTGGVRRFLRTAIVWVCFLLIAVLAVPACLFLVPIVLIWSLTDKVLRKLEE